MDFSLDRFYRLNRKAIIWIVLFGLIYLLRDFFTLVFLTFIITFFALPAVRYLNKRLRVNQTLAVLLVYLALFIGYIALYVLVLPNVVRQAASIRANLPSIQAKLNEIRTSYSDKYPNIAWLLNFDVESSLLHENDIRNWQRFVERLNSDTAPSAHVREMLPPRMMSEIGRYFSGTSTNAPSPEFRDDRDVRVPSLPAEVIEDPDFDRAKEELVAAINRSVIDNPEFFQDEEIAVVTERLSREGLDLLNERENRSMSQREAQKLNRLLLEAFYPNIEPRNYQAEKKLTLLIDEARAKAADYIPNFALTMLKFFATSLLAILFSFLIVVDYARLSNEVKSLATSRLRDFFAEAGQPVVKFAISVGEGFQAIATIALITTAMVVIALFILGIPSVAFLAVVAFVTSLVPVVGVVFEVVPIVLVALNTEENGPERAFWAIIALTIIHIIIGYVITPIIFGRRFKLNLVAVLFVLYIGNQLAGVWGMILGVPIANYLLRDVLGVPVADEKGRVVERPNEEKPKRIITPDQDEAAKR